MPMGREKIPTLTTLGSKKKAKKPAAKKPPVLPDARLGKKKPPGPPFYGRDPGIEHPRPRSRKALPLDLMPLDPNPTEEQVWPKKPPPKGDTEQVTYAKGGATGAKKKRV